MDHFFRCQKSTFNLENNDCLCQGKFFVYHVTGSTYSGILFGAMYNSRYIQNFERDWKNAIWIRVSNSVKHLILFNLHKEKN